MDVITFPLLLRWVGALLLTLCLMAGATYLLQNGQLNLRQRNQKRLRRLESLQLTRQTTAHLLEVDGAEFLALTSQSGTTLQPLTTPKKAQKVSK